MNRHSAILLVIFSVSFVSAQNLPESFYGKFSLDHSDNFDEYLTEKGYGWFTRRLVTLSNVDKIITKAGPNSFNFEDLWATKKLHYKDVVLGREFRGKGLDGSIHRITFTLRNNVLFEKHVPTDANAEQKQDEYRYHLEGGNIVQTLTANGVVARRYFTRQ
ncbi:hypothetical protein PRIPAC_96747 [Pristionchus pacificus]|uniref:FABP domain-containing protein n=1 Tax=Pristionchus pacificus TaxID=54126 RepID=A0A454XNR1_PRIPA|nr:hypothetical protein PRIPAC_96747 [Pristionchus pacificus]|eukprot:PDM84059.1 hypothetical protein PRIPAC_34251 [Pristionchus pacificus]